MSIFQNGRIKDDENFENGLDRIENQIFTKEMAVLNFLIETFLKEEFSIKEIRESYPELRIGEKTLKSLQKKDLLYKNPKTLKFNINHASSKISRVIMEYENPIEGAEGAKKQSNHNYWNGEEFHQEFF